MTHDIDLKYALSDAVFVLRMIEQMREMERFFSIHAALRQQAAHLELRHNGRKLSFQEVCYLMGQAHQVKWSTKPLANYVLMKEFRERVRPLEPFLIKV